MRSLSLRLQSVLRTWFVFGVVTFLHGCASGGNNPTPPVGGSNPTPPVIVTISPLSANVQTGKIQQFTIVVSNAANTAVTWQVNGVSGGDTTHGMITSTGIYAAPASIPNPATVTVTAVSQADRSKIASAQVTITAASVPLSITTTSLPNGQVNVPYSATLAATGGTIPYAWSLTSGTLPTGLSLNAATGAITGTPTQAVSNSSLTFKVTDAGSPFQSQSVTLTLTVTPSVLVITTTSLPNGQVNVAYSTTLAGTGGTIPYTWSLTSGTLPTGLSLNAATGAISGMPTQAVSNSSLTFKVTDSGATAQSMSVTLTLTVTAPKLVSIAVTPADPSDAAGNSQQFTATGTYSDSSTQNLTSSVTWASSSTATATITSSGLVTAITPGTATISATLGSVMGSTTLTVLSPSNISVSVTPKRGGLAIGQTLSTLTATVVNDASNKGVTWSASGSSCSGNTCGTFSPASSASGAKVTYTAPSVAGIYAVTATSAADITKSFSITVGVTDLPGVFTYHNNLSRDGTNPSEYALTTSNVTSTTFGKLFSLPVDGLIFAQPLYMSGVTVGTQVHNLVFVATEHDTVYAWDADTSSPVWSTSFINPAGGVTTVPCGEAGSGDCSTIYPEFGITGTPVIDSSTGTLYVVAATKEVFGSTTSYVYRLHALNIATGQEKFGGPVAIQATSGSITFVPKQHLQRPGLLLVNGVVYIGFASHGDMAPWYGWLMGYNASTLQGVMAFNTSPNAGEAGIWQSGAGPAADASGNIYFNTGNGVFDANTGGADYGDSIVKLNASGTVLDYFTPYNQATLYASDLDVGSSGLVLLPDQTGTYAHVLIGSSKQGIIYSVNRDNMGKFNAAGNQNIQSLPALSSKGLFGSPAYWNGYMYFAAWNDYLRVFQVTNGMVTQTSHSSVTLAFPGATPSVSSNSTSNGIVWIIQEDVPNNTVITNPPTAILRAYDATNLANELYDSTQAPGNRDAAGGAVKFAVPTVANGKVYVGNSNQLTVYGLLP